MRGMKACLGAGDGIRTRDIDLGKVALYQLSYSRPIENHYFPSLARRLSNLRLTRCGSPDKRFK